MDDRIKESAEKDSYTIEIPLCSNSNTTVTLELQRWDWETEITRLQLSIGGFTVFKMPFCTETGALIAECFTRARLIKFGGTKEVPR
tara:strand:+ start:895 stop:1155 length:261 start_codon:yes stop_codon:yes gene_type:complete